MKRFTAVIIAAVLPLLAANAEGLKLGGHGAYSIGGDVEDSSFGYGLQLSTEVNDMLSVEIAGTMFEDSDSGVDLEVTTFSACALLGTEIMDGVRVYGGAGINYTLYDADGGGYEFDLDNSFGYLAVAGAEMMLSDGLSLFGEYRYNISTLEGDVVGLGEIDDDYNFGLIIVGVNLVL